MTTKPTRSPAPTLDSLRVPLTAAAPAVPAPLPAAPPAPAPPAEEDDEWQDPVAPYDPATFDPAEFEWRPVPRRPRADGWTPDVQRGFIQALAETGLVEDAARAVDMSVQSAYRLRHAPGGEGFARAWEAAAAKAAGRALDVAFTRAIQGEYVPLFDRDGCRAGGRWRTSDRLLMFILRAYMPDRFRHAHRDTVAAHEPPPPAAVPLDEAVAALVPPVPPAPHLLAEQERMACLVEGARGRAAVEAEHPRDDRERFAYPQPDADPPRARVRRHRRRQRDDRREAREEQLFGPVDPAVYADRAPPPEPDPLAPFMRDGEWPSVEDDLTDPPAVDGAGADADGPAGGIDAAGHADDGGGAEADRPAPVAASPVPPPSPSPPLDAARHDAGAAPTPRPACSTPNFPLTFRAGGRCGRRGP